MNHVTDDPKLLKLLLEDQKREEAVWRATRYWTYRLDLVLSEIRSAGIRSFRANDKILSSFGAWRPSLFYRKTAPELDSLNTEISSHAGKDSAWSRRIPVGLKKFIARRLLNLPGFSHAFKGFQVMNLCVLADRFFLTSLRLLRELALQSATTQDLMQDAFDSGLGDPTDLVGPPARRIGHDGLMAVHHLARIRTLMQKNNPHSILEIGGGYGSLCEMSLRCLRALKTYVILDLAPVAYLSTQYLKACFPGEVADYRDLRHVRDISLEDFGGKRIVILPVWKLRDLRGGFDLFVNTASFQEMEPPVVQNYIRYVTDLCQNAYIWTTPKGHGPGFNQRDVKLRDIESYFGAADFGAPSGRSTLSPDALSHFYPQYVSQFFTKTAGPIKAF